MEQQLLHDARQHAALRIGFERPDAIRSVTMKAAAGQTCRAASAWQSYLDPWTAFQVALQALPNLRLGDSSLGNGFIIGFVGAVMGIGGGFLLVPIVIYVLRVPTGTVIGTSMVLTLVIHGLRHASLQRAGTSHSSHKRTLARNLSIPRFQVGLSEQCETAHTRTHLPGVLSSPERLDPRSVR
jgi:predicted histidine transporter YuiF (NhaC family)